MIGSTAALTDGAGNVANRCAYDPYGEQISFPNRSWKRAALVSLLIMAIAALPLLLGGADRLAVVLELDLIVLLFRLLSSLLRRSSERLRAASLGIAMASRAGAGTSPIQGSEGQMGERRTQQLRIGLIALTALIGVGVVFASLLISTTPLTTISTALAVIVLMSSAARLAGEGSALGKRHTWLFASIPIGMLLQVVVFLTLWRILGLDRTTAFYAALPVALPVATIVGLYGVRETR